MTNSPSRRDPYDALPYVSMPITYSQPSLLAAQAILRGLEAPGAETARVLEIGAASGGNIIPLAARFPNAHFLGIDLAETHIEIGQRRIADLGLANIRLEQGDIAEADFGASRFDYIICHGVFSWAPAEARHAILKVCADTLSENGIAAISFNVFPGWHARNVIRDICLEHTRSGGSPRQQVESVRELLKSLAETTNEKAPYGSILRAEAARLNARPASYILGELLAAYNQPFHVRDVIDLANAQGLSYLSEADLVASSPETAAPAAAARIRSIAGDDPVALEQYTDIFSGRTFRRSLFIRSGRNPTPPSPERLQALHVSANPKAGPSPDPAGSALHATLSTAHPASVPAASLPHPERLYQLIAAGRVSLSSVPLASGNANPTHPHLWNVARADAATGQPWITSRTHAPVLLTPILRPLAPLMDGHTSRAQLVAALEAALKSGALREQDLPDASAGPDRLPLLIERLIQHCARNALLGG